MFSRLLNSRLYEQNYSFLRAIYTHTQLYATSIQANTPFIQLPSQYLLCAKHASNVINTWCCC